MTRSVYQYRACLPEGTAVNIEVAGSMIRGVETISNDESLPYALPVLVDLQQNGGLGTYYMMADQRGVKPLQKIAWYLRQHGVGRVLLTTATCRWERLREALRKIDEYLSSEPDMAHLFFSLFHEGVFISPREGWRGAHKKDWVMSPDYDKFKEVDESAGGRIGFVNVAPEEPGGLRFIERAVADGKTVTLGHCCPTPDIVYEAARRGASIVTHFGNGAAPKIHRFTNPFWAMLDEPALKLGLICDGHHLPPEVVRVALRCKEQENCFPVSDASGASGLPPGKHYDNYAGRHFVIEEDRRLHLADSEIMMGAWFQQDRSVEFLVYEVGMSFLEAWRQCSEVPARIAGIKLPRIAVGEEASFVIAHWDEGVVIDQAVHRGIPYLKEKVRPLEAAEA